MTTEDRINNIDLMNTEISMFATCFDKLPCGKISFGEWLTEDKFRSEVERVRRLYDEGDTHLYQKAKERMPCVTPSGIFDNLYEGAVPSTYSHFMCIDIDKKDNLHIADFDRMKEKIGAIRCVAYCGHSISGKGFMLLVPIAYPEKYALQYAAFEEDLSKFGIKTDPLCKNIGRLRICSYDPEPYINPNAATYHKCKERVAAKPVLTISGYARQRTARTTIQNSPEETEKKIRLITESILKYGIDITGSYKEWFMIGCALVDGLGERGRAYFHQISSVSNKYERSECDKQYTRCQNPYCGRRIRIASFFDHCKNYGLCYNMKQQIRQSGIRLE